MFGKSKKDEVVVRGLDEKFIKRMKEINEEESGIASALNLLTTQLAQTNKAKMKVWEDIYDEYELSSEDEYRMNHETAEITRIGR